MSASAFIRAIKILTVVIVGILLWIAGQIVEHPLGGPECQTIEQCQRIRDTPK